jgi:hypothetical protein
VRVRVHEQVERIFEYVCVCVRARVRLVGVVGSEAPLGHMGAGHETSDESGACKRPVSASVVMLHGERCAHLPAIVTVSPARLGLDIQ